MNPTSSDRYPRSVPFQASKNVLAAPLAAKPWFARHQLLLGAGGAVLIVGVVAGIVQAINRPSAPPAPPPADIAKPAEVPAKTANDCMLETLGGLCAAHLYQSYLNIGLVADAVEHETYTESHATQMLANVAGLMDVVDKQLERLIKMDLSADDKRDVQRIRAISSLMRVQIASLRAYWLTNDQKHATRYHETREKAWAGLTEVLGL
jgi:hypothetical protein